MNASQKYKLSELKELREATKMRIRVAETDQRCPNLLVEEIAKLKATAADLLAKAAERQARLDNLPTTLVDLNARLDELNTQIKEAKNAAAIARLLKLQAELNNVS